MIKLGYLDDCLLWIKPYYFIVSDSDEGLSKAFCTPGDTYSMPIDNLDVKLTNKRCLPLAFDPMMQRMHRAKNYGGQSTSVLLTPKWSIVKDSKKMGKR